jgi:hypothetical protein
MYRLNTMVSISTEVHLQGLHMLVPHSVTNCLSHLSPLVAIIYATAASICDVH